MREYVQRGKSAAKQGVRATYRESGTEEIQKERAGTGMEKDSGRVKW